MLQNRSRLFVVFHHSKNIPCILGPKTNSPAKRSRYKSADTISSLSSEDLESSAQGSNKKTQKKKPILGSKPCIPHLLWNTCKFKRKCLMIHDLPGFPKLCQRYLSNPSNSNCSKYCALEHMSKAKAQDIAFNLAKKLQTPTATTSKQSLPGKHKD